MGRSFGHAGHQRQYRSSAVQRLDLGLLVNAQHDRGIGWVQVEPHDVADLLDEQRVWRELEALALVRLKPESAPYTADRGLAHPGGVSHRARRPVRRICGLLLKRLNDDPLDVI